MPVPDHRVAICRRCRQPERRSRGAADADAMLATGRACAANGPVPVHVRLSQCLNCCDGGHTVRVECRGAEVALVGVRTADELAEVFAQVERLGARDVPDVFRKRVWQEWQDGVMVYHYDIGSLEEGDTAGPAGASED